jgi:hypothetical protein
MFDDIDCAGDIDSFRFNVVSPRHEVFVRLEIKEERLTPKPDSALEFQCETLKNARFSLTYRAAGGLVPLVGE